MKLSELFTYYGSDKASQHSYGEFYDHLAETMPINAVLEIGIHNGFSMQAWQKRFPNAIVIGIDNVIKETYPAAMKVLYCNVPDMDSAIGYFLDNNLSFDLIVDDASHHENDQVLASHYLMEFLNPGGVYVIEDLDSDHTMKRFKESKWEVVDLRHVRKLWDDVLCWKRK